VESPEACGLKRESKYQLCLAYSQKGANVMFTVTPCLRETMVHTW